MDLTPAPQQARLINFPCHFPLKVMGETHDAFATHVIATIQRFSPEFGEHLVEMRASAGGKYISLTCRVYATSQAQLDDIYRALTSHPMVKVVL